MQDEPGWVLVADDDVVGRMIVCHMIEQLGHRATVADDGEAALALLRAEPFDVVLLDVVMPVLDGFGVLEAMKADRALRHIPVIMMSAVDDAGAAVRGIESGAEDYLPKPVDRVLLRARLAASLTRKRLHDRHAVDAADLGRVVAAAIELSEGSDGRAALEQFARRSDTVGQVARAFLLVSGQGGAGQGA